MSLLPFSISSRPEYDFAFTRSKQTAGRTSVVFLTWSAEGMAVGKLGVRRLLKTRPARTTWHPMRPKRNTASIL